MIERATSVALSFGIHFGIMNSNIQNYTDEDLTKRLQELMETPHPQKDASDFKSTETIVGKTIGTSALKDIRKIELSLSTSDIADYTDGCIIVSIQARKGSMIKEAVSPALSIQTTIPRCAIAMSLINLIARTASV